jgi:hypothetical protein
MTKNMKRRPNSFKHACQVLGVYARRHGSVAKRELIESITGESVLPLETDKRATLITAATSSKVVVFSTFRRVRRGAIKPNY